MATSTHPGYTDRKAVDEHRQRVGKITDVILGDHDEEVTLATVRAGLLAGERLIPLKGVQLADNGTVVVPFEREHIRQAPRVPRSHILTPEIRADVVAHFDLAS